MITSAKWRGAHVNSISCREREKHFSQQQHNRDGWCITVGSAGDSVHYHLQPWHFRVHCVSDEEGNARSQHHWDVLYLFLLITSNPSPGSRRQAAAGHNERQRQQRPWRQSVPTELWAESARHRQRGRAFERGATEQGRRGFKSLEGKNDLIWGLWASDPPVIKAAGTPSECGTPLSPGFKSIQSQEDKGPRQKKRPTQW